MVAVIWGNKFTIIDSYPEDDVYSTLNYTESEILDGDPAYFSEQFEDAFQDYDSQDEILLANFTWTILEEEEEAYRWLVKESFNV